MGNPFKILLNFDYLMKQLHHLSFVFQTWIRGKYCLSKGALMLLFLFVINIQQMPWDVLTTARVSNGEFLSACKGYDRCLWERKTTRMCDLWILLRCFKMPCSLGRHCMSRCTDWLTDWLPDILMICWLSACKFPFFQLYCTSIPQTYDVKLNKGFFVYSIVLFVLFF